MSAAGPPSAVRRATVLACAALALAGCSTGSGQTDRSAPASPAPASSSPASSPEVRATPPAASPVAPSSPATPGSPSASASGPEGQSRPELARFYNQQPRWRPCDGTFECAKVSVPIDYAKPQRGTLDLAVIRLKAAPGPDRIGSLLINPGGPGGSGLDYARSAEAVLTEQVRKRYDVVGFDPRGVGKSTPVECLTDPETDRFIAADGSPDTAEEQQELADTAELLARGCQRRSGQLLAHVGTRDAARDMDVLRGVLGDERLHYLGKSYGTYLGATYAELFPDRVGAMVLDGALNPAADGVEVSLEQAKGFEAALGAFVDDCLRISDCPLEQPRDTAIKQVGAVLEQIDRTPLKTSEARKVPQALAVLGVATALYDQTSGWPLLRAALREAQDGKGDSLLVLADVYTERQPDGSYASNSNEVIYAVNCLDRPQGADRATFEARAEQFAQQAPIFGRYLAWSDLPCSRWPVPPTNTPHAITAPGARPILVVGTTRDPATPYKWAVALADQLESGVLLSWDGDGHTAYRRGSVCVDSTVDAYLLRGEVPENGKRCT